MHLSSAAALDQVPRGPGGRPARLRRDPAPVPAPDQERFEEPDGAKYVGAPPLRTQADRDALWRGLAAGDIDTVCSDHAPWTLDAKLDPALNVVTARQGVADLETLMPMLFSEGVVTGRISLDRFVELTSGNAARLFGLHPRKGTIATGSDADLVLWDPQQRKVIDGARCSHGQATRPMTAGPCRAGRDRSSGAARSCSATARSRPGPAKVGGCAAARPRPPGSTAASKRPRRRHAWTNCWPPSMS